MPRRTIDLTGERFGRWTVIGQAPMGYFNMTKKRFSDTLWVCRCDCGTVKLVRGGNLRGGKTTSCGCYRSEVVSSAQTERHRRNRKMKESVTNV